MVFDAMLLYLIWIGVARALWIHWRDDQLWILFGVALLLLLATAPSTDNFDARFRTPAIPFLAAIAGVGWASLASLVDRAAASMVADAAADFEPVRAVPLEPQHVDRAARDARGWRRAAGPFDCAA